MLSVDNSGDGKNDKKESCDCSDIAKLPEVHDILEVNRATEFDSLVPHGLDQLLRDIALVQSWLVLELYVGDKQGTQLRVALFYLKSGRERIIFPAVLTPFAVVDPYQDSHVHEKKSKARKGRHLGLGKEPPVDEKGHCQKSNQPESKSRGSADAVPSLFLTVGLSKALFDAVVLSFGHCFIQWLSCSISLKRGYLSVAGTTRHLPARR